MQLKPLQELDKDLDTLKDALYSQDTLKLDDNDLIVLKSINAKFKDVVGLVNYLARNQRELCSTTR